MGDLYKKNDNYHFSFPFEYIKKNYGDGEYDMATAYMETDVVWDDSEEGYVINYYIPNDYYIDTNEGNGDEYEIFTCLIESQLMDMLDSIGIPAGAVSTLGR